MSAKRKKRKLRARANTEMNEVVDLLQELVSASEQAIRMLKGLNEDRGIIEDLTAVHWNSRTAYQMLESAVNRFC